MANAGQIFGPTCGRAAQDPSLVIIEEPRAERNMFGTTAVGRLKAGKADQFCRVPC
jgi:hypothetical protein